MEKFKAHILVVDDDDGIRELVKEYLSQNEYLVTSSNSAEDALEKVKSLRGFTYAHNEKAKELGIKIITIKDFFKML